MDDTVIVIRFNGMFVMNEVDRKWEYVNGRNKARLINTTCTRRELEEIVYQATNIDRNSFDIVMKYIFHSSHNLDPIEIENDGDVQCFIKEQFRVEAAHRSPLFIEVSPRAAQLNVPCDNAFVYGSSSNGCSSSVPAINRAGAPFTRVECEIPSNSRHGWCSSPVPLADHRVNLDDDQDNIDYGANMRSPNVESDGEEDDVQIELSQHDFVHNDHVQEYGEAEVDIDVNTPFEIPIVSEGYATVDPIVSQSFNDPLHTNVPYTSLRVEENIQRRQCGYGGSDSLRTARSNTRSTPSTVEPSTSNPSSLAIATADNIEVGQIYNSKRELQQKLGAYAMKTNHEFKVHKSCTQRFEVKCVDDNCGWRLRAARIEGFDFFSVRVFNNKHDCSEVSNLKLGHRQATSRHIGYDIMPKYDGIARQYRPKEIVFDIEKQYGFKISYDKAWRARETALNSIRGTPEDSFKLLPLWFSMLEKNNPGTLTSIKTADDHSFLYCFMALGQCRAGFSKVRHVVAVDGTHLKGRYKGTLYIAASFDGNEQIYPLAFGVGDTENESSYTWFFERFKEAYGEYDDLVFITDRHKGLETAIAKVYPSAHHGHCMYHLSGNVRQHFGQNKHVHMAFYQAAKAYLQVDFESYMHRLSTIDSRAYQYVMEANPAKWARSHFPGNRYSIMTTNIAECMNAVLKDARALPIVPLLECIRSLIQWWFYDRQNEAAATTTPVTPWLEKLLKKRIASCLTMDVTPLSSYEFEVRGIDMYAKLNLETRTCSCREFDLDRYPCIHAIAACRVRNISCYSLCSDYYSTSSWRDCYANTVYPLDDRHFWNAPPEILERVVLPPMVRRAPGRRRTRRIPSRGEDRPQRKCATCGQLGHNRRTCTGNV